MQGLDGDASRWGSLVAFHVQGDPLPDVFGRADRVDATLGFAVAAVAAFDGVAGGRQQAVIQEGQGLFQVRREQFVQRPPYLLEATDTPAECGQFDQGCLGPTSSIEQAVHVVHDLPEGSQVRQTSRDPLEAFSSRPASGDVERTSGDARTDRQSASESAWLCGLEPVGPSRVGLAAVPAGWP